MTGKVELTVIQMTLTDTLPMKGKPQKVIANGAGCSQSAVSKHVKGKFTGIKKRGRKRGDHSLGKSKAQRVEWGWSQCIKMCVHSVFRLEKCPIPSVKPLQSGTTSSLMSPQI